jgi:hypothetical protein
MNELTTPIEKSDTNDFSTSYRFYSILLYGIIVVIGCVLLIITFVLPENLYSLSYSLWYVDFRYWPNWVSVCCWLVFVWAVVSTLLTLIAPKSEEQSSLSRQSFFQKIIGLLFVLLLWNVWHRYATLPLAVIFEPITSPIAN